MFSRTVSIDSSDYVVTELVVEDKIISTAGNTDIAGGHHSASMTALCKMDKNEHAFIRTANHGGTHYFLHVSIHKRRFLECFTDETTVVETPTPTSNQDEVTQPITPSKPNNSKHKTGFDTAWLTAFTWLLVVKEPNSSGDMTDVMYCKLCKKHRTYGYNGSKTWVDNGYRCLRRDKIKEHQDSDQHKDSLKQEVNHTVSDMTAKISTTAQKSIRDALKVLYFLISHNLPLDMFSLFYRPLYRAWCNQLRAISDLQSVHPQLAGIQSRILIFQCTGSNINITSDNESPSYSVMVEGVRTTGPLSILQSVQGTSNPSQELVHLYRFRATKCNS
ncbi:unnamed protein product [Mytilus edulis]|uniref:C17orf113 probable zinc finger domain-containing protein n=1 Tax=Mytilus edulis TaxID=6550 RepID=A0A8S3TXU8_MYTED|nr:unnamed protein product [Mytilus edulis]